MHELGFANMQGLVDSVSSLISRGTLVLHVRRAHVDGENRVPSIDFGGVTQRRDTILQTLFNYHMSLSKLQCAREALD